IYCVIDFSQQMFLWDQAVYSYDLYRVSIHLSAFQHFHHLILFYSLNAKKSALCRLFRQTESRPQGLLFLFAKSLFRGGDDVDG
ncbi:MAG: hypothetical protein IJZ66_06325, partial [Oscillibacter sp.]|nr:hypothetical protein [Oscillibacter sp.]